MVEVEKSYASKGIAGTALGFTCTSVRSKRLRP